jgi:hypothetical protein
MNRIKNADDMELSERYDAEDDIYYVTIKTGEPSFAIEHDDRLIIENGLFTRMPTGFRILNYSKIKNARYFKEVFKEVCKKASLSRERELKARTEKIDRFLEKVEA